MATDYTSRSAIEAVIPAPLLVQALDDNNDGAEDTGALSALLSVACDAVDARIEAVVTLPLASPYPAIVRESALVFFCELIYAKRNLSPNPWKDRADKCREILDAINKGEKALTLSRRPLPSNTAPTLDFSKTNQEGA